MAKKQPDLSPDLFAFKPGTWVAMGVGGADLVKVQIAAFRVDGIKFGIKYRVILWSQAGRGLIWVDENEVQGLEDSEKMGIGFITGDKL